MTNVAKHLDICMKKKTVSLSSTEQTKISLRRVKNLNVTARTLMFWNKALEKQLGDLGGRQSFLRTQKFLNLKEQI